MANIYEQDSEALNSLLERARSDHNANLLIPDLQRPYVWSPNQVTLLIDSLIRGWPFGTLLLWNVRHNELKNIPNRAFWRVVDRTGQGAGANVQPMAPPAEFDMVLDGQQRVQSLLLALGGDTWGFQLEDREWAEELQDVRRRGPRGKYRHWSKGTLCFDLDAFLDAYEKSQSVWTVDYRTVLRWVITEPDGQSPWPKPENYIQQLLKAADYPGRFLRLSRLWQQAQPNPQWKEQQFRKALAEYLPIQEVPAGKIEKLLGPLAELCSTLRDVKLSKVTFLQLLPFDPAVMAEDDYNDAIVNIFTQLNTAGRTLTREEITFAWLKSGWAQATQSFESLAAELALHGIAVSLDDLVAGISIMWSATFNGGRVLANKDLLRGDIIRPMAEQLAVNWNLLAEAVGDATVAVDARSLRYGQNAQFNSLNALAILWTWQFLARRWLNNAQLNATDTDAFEKQALNIFNEFCDRWLVCSQWATI